MSPVEPRPVVMGTMGLPSAEGANGLGFLPNMPAALNFAGVNRLLVAAPSAARNERRFQRKFKFIRSFLSGHSRLFISKRSGGIHHRCAAYDFNQRITWNPLEGHAGARRRFARGEISPVDFVQRIVLRFMGIEPR